MPTIQDYLNLITSEHFDQPDFSSMVGQCVSPMVQVQNLLTSMIALFDLGTPPVGNQLDIIGLWVGVSRNVVVPITGVLFTWDGTITEGWDYGIWSSSDNPDVINVLPDDAYLTLIEARIAANRWDGTTEGAYAIWAIVFPQYTFLIQDNQNMSFDIAIIGSLDSLTFALLTEGYLPLKPEGIAISNYLTLPPPGTGSFFAWDSDSPYLQGWDTGSWAIETAGS
jgi:hypothetical protein